MIFQPLYSLRVSRTYPQFSCCCFKIPLTNTDLVLQKPARMMSEKHFSVTQLKEDMILDVQFQISVNKVKENYYVHYQI